MKMFKRSGVDLLSSQYAVNRFHTNAWLREKQKENETEKPKKQEEATDDKSDKKPETDSTKEERDLDEKNRESIKRAERERRKQQEKKENEKDNDQTKKVLALFTKGVAWTLTAYGMAILFMVILSAMSRGGPINEDINRQVSWQEFVYHMLAVGEVKELIVRPDADLVAIVLHEGAIVKGRRAGPYYILTVPDVGRFEEKLRDIERKLGITDSELIIIC